MTARAPFPSKAKTHFPIAPYPVVGHFPQLLGDSMKFFLELGLGRDLPAYHIGGDLRYFVNHPDGLREIWQSPLYQRQPVIRKVMSSVVGQNLFSQEGADHRRPRRMMQPAFHREKLGGYLEPMVRHAKDALERWTDGQKLDLNCETKRVALDIVGESLFSLEEPGQVREITNAVEAILPRLDSYTLLYGLLPDQTKVGYWGKDRTSLKTIRSGLEWIVRSRRALKPQAGDLMDMLLETRDEDGTGLDDTEVAAQALTLMSAGFETTANTLTWMFYLLDRHPEIRAKLEAEVDTVLGQNAPTLEDLPRLKYTEMVVKETLRLYPAAWITSRVPIQDVVLLGTPIKAGTPLLTSAFVTHRDPRYFPKPERFWPERFAEEGNFPKFAYLPFGAGIHQCIGNIFAMWEMKVILAMWAAKVRLELPKNFTPEYHLAITLGLKTLPVTVRLR
jgi:cytochrome P450